MGGLVGDKTGSTVTGESDITVEIDTKGAAEGDPVGCNVVLAAEGDTVG